MSFTKEFREAHEEFQIQKRLRSDPSARNLVEAEKAELKDFKERVFNPYTEKAKAFMLNHACGVYDVEFYFNCPEDNFRTRIVNQGEDNEFGVLNYCARMGKSDTFTCEVIKKLIFGTFDPTLFTLKWKYVSGRCIIVTLEVKPV